MYSNIDAHLPLGEYISESVWASRQDFMNWRDSQKFSKAHGGKAKDSSEGKVSIFR
jgi:heme-degrading monooxygenase HmoA